MATVQITTSIANEQTKRNKKLAFECKERTEDRAKRKKESERERKREKEKGRKVSDENGAKISCCSV